ncbi:MAG: DUF4403 family protein [Fusobacteriaceae bacterium]
MSYQKKIIFLSLLLFAGNGSYSAEKNSQINLEISVKKSAINEILENEIPRNFSGDGIYEVASQGGSKSQLLGLGLSLLKNFKTDIPTRAFWKYSLDRGAIFLSAKGNNISASTDFSGKANGILENSSKNVEADFNGNLGVSTSFNITEEWQLFTKTSPLLNLSNSMLPLQLEIAGLKIDEKISMRSELEKRINPILQKTARDLDTEIAQFNLKEFIDKQWKNLKDPLQINKTYDVWLVARPKKAYYGGIHEKADTFSIVTGTEAELFLSVGKPETIHDLGVLPKIYSQEKENMFTLNLPVILKYNAIKKTLEENFLNKVFKLFRGGELTLKKIDLQGDGRTLNLKSNFILSLFSLLNLEAGVTLYGTPQLFEDKKVLSLENFSFKIDSDSFILKIADKFFHKKIEKMILENYLSFNIEKDVPLLQKALSEKVKILELEKNIILNTNIQNLSIEDISIDNNGVIIYSQILGNSILDIKKLKK